MKKLLAILLCAAMTLSMIACGAKEEEAPAEAPAETPAEEEAAEPAEDKPEYTITIATAYNDGHYMVQGYEAFKEYVE